MSGNARGASSAFCLLFRLAQLKPTEDQVQEMLDHGDSPYIRAVGDDLRPGVALPTPLRLLLVQFFVAALCTAPPSWSRTNGMTELLLSGCALPVVSWPYAFFSHEQFLRGGCLQVGFLYLRYVLNPRQVWEWIDPYLGDHEVGVRREAVKTRSHRSFLHRLAVPAALQTFSIHRHDASE